MNQWILDHLINCKFCVVTESTEHSGDICQTCGRPILNHEVSFVVHMCAPYHYTYLVCHSCMCWVYARQHRKDIIDSVCDTATKEFRQAIDEFKKRLKHG